jgi:hypothetical protein
MRIGLSGDPKSIVVVVAKPNTVPRVGVEDSP